jgi:hypothetical protein
LREYGIYIRPTDIDVWRLDRITTWEEAQWAEEFNAQFGFQTMILGPQTEFRKYLES